MPEKVLIVDDDRTVIESLRDALHREPYEILGAESTLEAKAILGEQVIDVVVIDERMPGQSGSEFLTELAKDYPDLPRIMLTGFPSLDVAVRSINNGEVFKFLQKPCRPEELASTIRAALQRRAVAVARERLVDHARRTASAVADLEREGGTAPGSTPAASTTQEMLAVDPAELGNADPLELLPADELAALSKREKEILRLLVAGRKPQEIAHALFISIHTARNHIKAIYQKLLVHSQSELIAKVLRAPGRHQRLSLAAGRARSV